MDILLRDWGSCCRVKFERDFKYAFNYFTYVLTYNEANRVVFTNQTNVNCISHTYLNDSNVKATDSPEVLMNTSFRSELE